MNETVAVKIRMRDGRHRAGLLIGADAEERSGTRIFKFVDNSRISSECIGIDASWIEYLPEDSIHALDACLK